MAIGTMTCNVTVLDVGGGRVTVEMQSPTGPEGESPLFEIVATRDLEMWAGAHLYQQVELQLSLTTAKWRKDDQTPASPPADEEHCPRCGLVKCSAECIAKEQAEDDVYDGPILRKFA